jgi:hypothetical protein
MEVLYFAFSLNLQAKQMCRKFSNNLQIDAIALPFLLTSRSGNGSLASPSSAEDSMMKRVA